VTSHRPAHSAAFNGFLSPDRDKVAVPAGFFTEILPDITDINELRVLLSFFRLLAGDAGFEAPIAEPRLLQDASLKEAVRVDGTPSGNARQAIQDGLGLLVTRGVILRVTAKSKRRSQQWLFLHTPVTRELVEAIQRGALSPPRSMWLDDEPPSLMIDPPTAFSLYEQNIGPLTPMVADRISRALRDYPVDWVEDAIGEAVAYNRRSWKYIERILESWTAQGRPDRS